MLSLATTLFCQNQYPQDYRTPNQICIEDSTRIFWTNYPNPFSPPTIKDTTQGMICGGFTFYCDLSDTVEVSLIGENDSVLTTTRIITHKPPNYSFCYWMAGSNVALTSIPTEHFKATSNSQLNVLLSVNGRKKNIRLKVIYIPKGLYCWINDYANK
jgi:hypothetical protein